MDLPEKKYTLLESFFVFLFSGIAIPLIVIITFPLTMLSAWIRYNLWNWFAVPYLHLPVIPYWAVVGLGFLVSTFYRPVQPSGYKATTSETCGTIFWPILAELIGLGIGYIIHTRI